jgi:hypothetical protein
MMPRSNMRCIATSSGSLKPWTATSSHSGTWAASRRPAPPIVSRAETITIRTARMAIEGGTRSHSRNVPRSATIQVIAIHAVQPAAINAAARAARAAGSPERRQAYQTPAVIAAASAIGTTMNTSTDGSVSE